MLQELRILGVARIRDKMASSTIAILHRVRLGTSASLRALVLCLLLHWRQLAILLSLSVLLVPEDLLWGHRGHVSRVLLAL